MLDRGTPSIEKSRWRLAALKVDVKLRRLSWILWRGFDPNQPRQPAGSPEGGQWTDAGGSIRIAQNTSRGAGGRGRAGGRWPDATPAQQARLAATRAQADAALRKVRDADPNWRPTPNLYENVEGEIAANLAQLREANARYSELQRTAKAPGEFANQSLPSDGTNRNFSVEARRQINEFGYRDGCRTCGSREPGTPSGNFVPDHQPPISRNPLGSPMRLYPQCLGCRRRQGGFLSHE